MFPAPCSMLPALCFLRKPVLRPGIGGVTVAADFPETRLVFGNEFDRANKLGPFPGIKLRDDHAGGATVIARDRLPADWGATRAAASEGFSRWTLGLLAS